MSAGVYVHVPFCAQLCPYCDAAKSLGNEQAHDTFLRALEQEIAWRAPKAPPLDWIHLGGGSPTALAPARLASLRRSLSAFPLSPSPSFTLEVNPEDVSPSSLEAWQELGVTRLALGIQSFEDEALSRLGRRHDGATASSSLEAAVAAPGLSVSAELLFGLEGQSLEDWRRELEQTVAHRPDHVSCQQLAGERQAPEDLATDMLSLAHELLPAAGLEAHELASFSRAPEHRAALMEAVWSHEAYLGLGPSAASFEPEVGPQGRRSWNDSDWLAWSDALEKEQSPLEGMEILTAHDRALEMLMFGLCRPEGFSPRELSARTQVDILRMNEALLAELEGRELLVCSEDRIVPSSAGLLQADQLVSRFTLTDEAE